MLMRADSFLCWDWDDPDPDLSEKFYLGMHCHFIFSGWLSFVLREIRAEQNLALNLLRLRRTAFCGIFLSAAV